MGVHPAPTSRPRLAPGDRAPTTAEPSRASSTCSSPAAAGRTCRASTARRQPCGADSNAGARRASGSASGGRHLPRLTCRPARLDHGLPRRLVRARQEGRREGRPDEEGEGHQVDAGRRRQWSAAGLPPRQRNIAEVRLAEQTLDTIRFARPRGRPKRRPEKLVADRGYDSSAFRRALRRRGIRMCIPPKRRPANWKAKRGRPVVARKDDYRQRYTVERSFAWLGNFRRLLIRWEHLRASTRLLPSPCCWCACAV